MGASPARASLPSPEPAAEYFATDVTIERAVPGLVRLVFHSGAAAVGVVVPERCCDRIATLLAMGIQDMLH